MIDNPLVPGSSPGGPTISHCNSWPYETQTRGLPVSHGPLVRSLPHEIHEVMALGPGDRGPFVWGHGEYPAKFQIPMTPDANNNQLILLVTPEVMRGY